MLTCYASGALATPSLMVLFYHAPASLSIVSDRVGAGDSARPTTSRELPSNYVGRPALRPPRSIRKRLHRRRRGTQAPPYKFYRASRSCCRGRCPHRPAVYRKSPICRAGRCGHRPLRNYRRPPLTPVGADIIRPHLIIREADTSLITYYFLLIT